MCPQKIGRASEVLFIRAFPFSIGRAICLGLSRIGPAHLRVKSLFEFLTIKNKDGIALLNFCQKLEILNTWMKSMAYNVSVKSNQENLFMSTVQYVQCTLQ